MCGRFTNRLTWREIHNLYGLTAGVDPGWRPRYNGAPTQRFPVLRLGADGRREIAVLRWGLIPFWAKDEKIAYNCINARGEEVAAKPARS